MTHDEGFFSGPRGAQIYYQCWLPETDPKAVLLVVHGMAEHSGRYMNVVNHFVPSGYAVYSLDHIGHGKSAGDRGFVKHFKDFTETLNMFRGRVHAAQPEKPLFIVGHSMGGLISANFVLDYPDGLAGAILSGPLVKVSEIPTLTRLLIKTLSTLAPKVGLLSLEAGSVSRDPEVVKAYEEDPLVYRGKASARLTSELGKAIQRVAAEAGNITLPILILQGGADKLCEPTGARVFFDNIGAADKTIEMYDGFFHEIFNEPEHARVLKDAEQWLEKRLAT